MSSEQDNLCLWWVSRDIGQPWKPEGNLWESWTETGTLLILVPCWQGLLSGLASLADAPTRLLHRTRMWHAGCDHQRRGSALYSAELLPLPQTLYSKQSFILEFRAWERFFCPEQYFVSFTRSSLMAQNVKNPSTMQEAQVWSLGQEDPLEKEMGTHSSILVWRIPWTEGLHRVTTSRTQLSGYTLNSTFKRFKCGSYKCK